MSQGEEIRSRTRRLEREEFERGGREPDEPPAAPRPAATMILGRPAADDFEVLLLKRPENSRFAAGAWVFAGGSVDEADGDTRLLARLASDHGREERAALVAAIREQFEETGLLVGPSSPPPRRLREARRSLLEGEASFREIVEGLGLDFRGLDAAYFARWITPEKLARRYDARFFLARHSGGEPELTDELVDARWATASRALEEFAAGRLPMLFPTRKTLETLAGYGELQEAIASLRRGPVETIRPRLLVREDGVEPVLPGDPGYREAGEGGAGSGRSGSHGD